MPDTIHDEGQTLASAADGKPENVTVGAAWIVSASACSASVGLLVQLASHHASSLMIVFACYGVGCVIVTPVALKRGPGFLATPHLKLQIARALAGFIYFGSLFVAFRTIPLVDGILLRSTAPIWVPILLWIFWKQHIPKRIWWPIALGFTGVALVLQPGFGAWAIGYPIALGSGIAYALNNIAARHINQAGEPVLRTMFYTFAVPTLILAIPAVLTWQAVPWETLLPMAGTGVGTVAIVALFVNGLRHAPAHLLAPFAYAAVVFAALLDWLFFDLIPNALTIAGILVVTTSCFLIMRANRPHA